MIEQLTMKNFKSHEQTKVKFFPGLNIFLGEVGTGKTSILEAISFALFGRYAGSVTKNALIRRGAESAEISLSFNTGAKRYRVDRVIKPSRTQKPKLAVSVYHSMEDLVGIPLYLAALGVDYKFYLWHYSTLRYETVLFALPT